MVVTRDEYSALHDVFAHILGAAGCHADDTQALKASWLATKLGPMIAVADEKSLLRLEFVDPRGLEAQLSALRRVTWPPVVVGSTPPIDQLEAELASYFDGTLRDFNTPIALSGTPFQALVWGALRAIPCGETRTYTDIARVIGRPAAVRAVGAANGANRLAIIVPCHRVTAMGGGLVSYVGGRERKAWLINHEREIILR